MTLHQQGRLSDAAHIYHKVLRQEPDNATALYLLGVVALQTRRLERAADLIGKSLALNPESAEGHCNYAITLEMLGRSEAALASYDKAIALWPDYADAYNNRGNTLQVLGRFAEAIASYDKAIEINPNYAEGYNNRGNALQGPQRLEEALASYDKAIELKPDYADAYNNRGNALRDLGRLEDAVGSYDQAITLRPEYAEAYGNRGNALQALRRFDEALASYDKAIALDPNHAEAHYNKGLCLLQLGDLARGLRLYEWRKRRRRPIGARAYPQPVWTGEQDIAGRTLFLYWEQGLGDTIQFCRYAKLAAARGARVVMEVQQRLVGLLRQLDPAIEVVGPDQAPAAFDLHASLMSLPLAFGTTLETIPAEVSYLRTDETVRALWLGRLPPAPKPRIGVVWSGSSGHGDDRNRSIEPAMFLPLLDGRAEWIALQREFRAGDLEVFERAGGMASFGEEQRDFGDAAALVERMDLVITVDTSVAHLAGAMGKPVWNLLAYNPDWRWLLDRDDSPWYPSMRLFRQQRAGEWSDVISRVGAALHNAIG